MASSLSPHPFGLSQIPGDPSFRSSAVNAIAVIPLLSSHDDKQMDKAAAVRSTSSVSKSTDSFRDLLTALQRHTAHSQRSSGEELLLVVPNSSLTRPGDWRYNDTPLKAFHWQHGCQRLHVFDGRPSGSRKSHDRLMNHTVTRDWIDLCPSRRTAAVIGVLNMHDCRDLADLHLAEEELQQWAERYATPPYEVTAHGRTAERDQPVKRLFVYDSFDEECQKIDLSKTRMGTSILAFPPTDEAHAQMMDLHLNVVVNDLAVAIFLDLENKIRESDGISCTVQAAPASSQSSSSARRSLTRIISGASSDGGEELVAPSAHNLTVSSMAGLVSPDSKLAKESSNSFDDEASPAPTSAEIKPKATPDTTSSSSSTSESNKPPLKPSSASTPLLLTPLDDYWEPSELSGRDVDAIRKRDAGRREKFAADLSLLAGSPLDAYERYLKAAEMCKSGSLDPLWYAASLEGCATAHIAMAEAGGFSIDEYLENNFQLPDEFMAAVKTAKDEKRPTTSKQTMPDIIFALCEEALDIVNRHPKLAPYHAELLLKLAWYAAESAETHLRCRWGEGDSCYPGELGGAPRWERTSVFKLQFENLKVKDEGGNPVAAQTLHRTKMVCDFLHHAVTLPPLDMATRVDVATQGVVLCLQGIKPMQWANSPTDRVVLPRKAAFFACIGAEAVSGGSAKNAGDLWLLATQLYSRAGGSNYGWGALRAACLSALSAKGTSLLCLEAAEQLLSLLSELSPDTKESAASRPEEEDAAQQPTEDHLDTSGHSDRDDSAGKAINQDKAEVLKQTANTYAKQFQKSFNQMKANSAFLAQQSKWAYDDPATPLLAPLGDASPLASSLTTLKSVWNNSDLNRCTDAQNDCITRIIALRRSLATSSSQLVDFPTIYDDGGELIQPLFVVSAKAVEAEARLEVEKAKLKPKESGEGAMATFFNPFENKRNAVGASAVTSVAEEEERAILVEFGNHLAVPLEITRCQLEFSGCDMSRVMATSLAFTLPPNAQAFAVQFPFTVLARSESTGESTDQGEHFEVGRIELACLGRSFSLPIKPEKAGLPVNSRSSFPVSMSEYRTSNKKKEVKSELETCFAIQAYPCQPRLGIIFADSHTPVESLYVDLADGELYTSPPLRLECYAGPSGRGCVEQLEIHIGGLPGLPGLNKKLFDTAVPPEVQSEAEFLREMFEKDLASPLKARILAEELALDVVNGGEDLCGGHGNIIRFQIAATHAMARKLKKDTQVLLRFRYRGRSNVSAQVWRNHEIAVKIKRSKGPRITAISFQPDLHTHCFSRELDGKLELKAFGKEADDEKMNGMILTQGSEVNLDERVGQHQSVNVCASDIGFLVTVSNDTVSQIQLSREDGPISSLAGHQIDQVLLRPSVSVKIPMIVPRIAAPDRASTVDSLVRELISSTNLVWKSIDSNGEEACGKIRIPPDCLRELIQKNPSFVTKVSDPPCTIELLVDRSQPSALPLIASLGSPGVEICVQIGVAEWVSLDQRKKCNVTMELCCVHEKDSTGAEIPLRDHVWAGKLRHKTNLAAADLDHKARLIFCSPGSYIVSACARISHELAPKGVEEIWWAPVAQRIVVERRDTRLAQ